MNRQQKWINYGGVGEVPPNSDLVNQGLPPLYDDDMPELYLVDARVKHVSSGSFMGRDDGYVTYEDTIYCIEGRAALETTLRADHIEVKQIRRVLTTEPVAVKPSEVRAVREEAMRSYAEKCKAEHLRELEAKKRRIDAEIARQRAS